MARDAFAAENAPAEGADTPQGQHGERPVVGQPFGER
jgi:hypothetical protein